jgi:hypothetical protein
LIRGLLPLSLEQEWWYTLRLMRPDQRLSLPLVRRIRGPLDAKALVAAIGMLFDGHSGLRVRLAFTDDGEPRLTVTPPDGKAPVTGQSVASASPEQFDAYVRRTAAFDQRSRWNPVRDPLWRMRLLRRAADDHVLIGTFDQLAFDQRALLIFERELWLAYSFARGEPGSLPPRGSDLAEALSRQRRHEERATTINHEYWTRQYGQAPSAVRWAAPPSGRRELVHWARDEDLAWCAAALAALAFQLTGQDRLAIYVTMDTREDDDVNLIGTFTGERPLVVDREPAPAGQVADRLAGALAHRHLRGRALADLTQSPADRPRRDLLVDYAADAGAGLTAVRPAELDIADARSREMPEAPGASLALRYRKAGAAVSMDLWYDPALVDGAVAATFPELLGARQ